MASASVGVVLGGDRFAHEREQRLLLKAEGVDVAEVFGLNAGTRQAKGGFQLISQLGVAVGVVGAESLGHAAQPLGVLLEGGFGYEGKGSRWLSLEITAELIDERVAERLVARSGYRWPMTRRLAALPSLDRALGAGPPTAARC